MDKLIRHYNIFQQTQNRTQRILWISGLLLFLAASVWLDYNTNKSLNLFVLCLLAVILSACKLGLLAGILFSFLVCIIGINLDFFLQPEANINLILTTAWLKMLILSFLTYIYCTIQKLTENFIQLSLTDPLTGINNRRAFLLKGDLELNRTIRSKRPLSVLFIDIDDFKTINDTQGHEQGDQTLVLVAQTLTCRIRQIDCLARLGGDEFAIILPFTDSNGALTIGHALHALLKDTNLSTSIGIATFKNPPKSFEYALQCADYLMYQVKKSSKNAVLQKEFLL